jgi:hypothetical protein
MRVFIILIFICLSAQALADNLNININKRTTSTATCSKLLSALSIQKTFNFVFPGTFERHQNNIIINYKNFSGVDRLLQIELTQAPAQLNLLIKKGLFKDLVLNLFYKQEKHCEITGHLSWTGEEKRFSKSILTYSIEHYFDKLMSFLNRLI